MCNCEVIPGISVSPPIRRSRSVDAQLDDFLLFPPLQSSLSTRTANEDSLTSPPVTRRRAKTTPRGGFTPTSPLNRSFDSQAANRSSLIMLAVGHSSPRPKSMSTSTADADASTPYAGGHVVEEKAAASAADLPTTAAAGAGGGEEAAPGLDGRHFLRVVDQAERDIRRQIAQTETDLKEHGDAMCDEVSGILRTGVGKATLLVTDRFAQFRGLCHQNLASIPTNGDHCGEPVFATLSSDLEGFWEMVQLQVIDIRRIFAEIDSIRKNAWKPLDSDKEKPSHPPVSRPVPDQRKKPVPRRTPAGPSSKGSGVSSAREEARKRLLAAKREAMARRKADANANSSDVIFV